MAGPSSLRSLAEEEVLGDILAASQQLRPPFCAGGTLGPLAVRLALAGAGEAAAEARVVEFPGCGAEGERDLEALLALCAPATFGKGKKTVRDESYRSALALPADRIYTQHFEAAHLSSVLAAVGRVLLPRQGRCGFFKPNRDTPRGDPGFVASLVVCLPVGHAGGTLRLKHGSQSTEYEFGAGEAAGEVQWAAFFPDVLHEVLAVTEGTRVALAYELFARPETASGSPQPLKALPGTAAPLLRALHAALGSKDFLVNGGRIGFACRHAYPASLVAGVNEQAVRKMMKGADGAMLHVLAALRVPCTLVRVWQHDIEDAMDEVEGETEEDYARAERALFVSPIRAGRLTVRAGARRPRRGEGECDPEFLMKDTQAKLDISINWLGGMQAFEEWTLGTMGQFYGNEGMYTQEFYCSVGIVAEVPA
ncbi:hypothetical protein CHLNCDRAFT_144985 [Chlorella variabilis]|uniref:Prolyl 4-hydroxylase alpha subunit Fe(2+) 2OG dioxygenase domain-containing protein n=1 Tax=Chlorella variabilis TaxID=554065 RepID=E1ZDF7_CHLVA|nr:hypothetical protein CHLNCDRAFT_144985 [Chlorella variabilis]EFN56405.1 hypothetical protein CHLNCDRAFT_144985 [Chlorella variabilis]|eukprot:XP_005848507.1 hypothetical protein CHLNCDRAFT_144985 [Chlorella variabilis]